MLAQTIVILAGLGAFLAGHLYLLERYLDARLAQHDVRITGAEANLTTRIAGLETNLATRIAGLETNVNARFDEVERRFDQVETRLVRIEDTFLKDHGERIARLEALEHSN
jgi:hypothetical protein